MRLLNFYSAVVHGVTCVFCSISALAVEHDLSRPNIILCMTDDQGWGDTSYNGHPVLRTPNLDQMANEGIRFNRFYAGAPVCSPTRGSSLTGRHPHRYGVLHANKGHLRDQEITLAEVLKDQGYATGHFGKWHLGTMTTKRKDSNRGRLGVTEDYCPPWENSFDVCFSTEAKVPTYWLDDAYEAFGTHYWTGPEEKVPADQIQGDDSKLIMNRALPFIEQAAKSNTPFFTVIWFHAPHLPVISRPPYTDGYEQFPNYHGCITALDEQVGRLRKKLKQLSVEQNTMLWFCSDNGPEGGKFAPGRTKRLRGRKRSLYEGGVRVPGLLVWPDQIKQPRVVDMPCSTSDYFPTVLETLRYELPAEQRRPYDGVSLLPLIRGEMTERPAPIAFEFKLQLSLIDNRFKLYSSNSGDTFELYDLIADQHEKIDLANKHPEVLAAMKQQLSQWRASCEKSEQGADY